MQLGPESGLHGLVNWNIGTKVVSQTVWQVESRSGITADTAVGYRYGYVSLSLSNFNYL